MVGTPIFRTENWGNEHTGVNPGLATEEIMAQKKTLSLNPVSRRREGKDQGALLRKKERGGGGGGVRGGGKGGSRSRWGG